MLVRSPSPAAAREQASCKETSSRLLLFDFMQQCRQDGELQIVPNLFLHWRNKFPCKIKRSYITQLQRNKAVSRITFWFCTSFLLQMVSQELLIRRICCSLHLLLCYVFQALNLSGLPKTQSNHSSTLTVSSYNCEKHWKTVLGVEASLIMQCFNRIVQVKCGCQMEQKDDLESFMV